MWAAAPTQGLTCAMQGHLQDAIAAFHAQMFVAGRVGIEVAHRGHARYLECRSTGTLVTPMIAPS